MATYAALVGGRVLWVTLPEPAPVTLGPAGGEALAVPTRVDDSQAGHHAVRLDLSGLPAQEATYELRVGAGRGRPLVGPSVRAAAAGAGLALIRDEHDHLHVVRRVVAPGTTLRAVRLLGETVQLVLDVSGPGHELQLLDTGGALVTLPLTDGVATVAATDLDRGEHTLQVLVDGAPVHRRANDLAEPGAGVPLPALHVHGEPAPRGRFRWSADGLLVLRLVPRELEVGQP